MPDIKISLITVCFNAENTIARCIESVINQNFKNVEYIIIDGKSTDNTAKIIKKYENNISIFVSEPDGGIYDAMNKGIKLATGQVIGMLNADDFFADDFVLSDIAAAFDNEKTDIIYGDLDFIDSQGKIIRKWRSCVYKSNMFNKGWMPPHPTFYCRKNLFDKLGLYSLYYGTAADYELMLRFIHANKIVPVYIQKVMIKMNIGGASNKSYINRVKALLFDFKAMNSNGILFPPITLLLKPLRKIGQYF